MRTTLGHVECDVKRKMNILSVPFYYCVDVFVCSLNHLLLVHRSPACLRQTTARTQNEVQHFAGETRGASGFAQELLWSTGEGLAEPVFEHHMPFGACLESEAVRTAQDSFVGTTRAPHSCRASCPVTRPTSTSPCLIASIRSVKSLMVRSYST